MSVCFIVGKKSAVLVGSFRRNRCRLLPMPTPLTVLWGPVRRQRTYRAPRSEVNEEERLSMPHSGAPSWPGGHSIPLLHFVPTVAGLETL